jgi:Domain of unknown function (DUF4129)
LRLVRPSVLRSAWLGAAVLALLALVAVASRSDRHAGPGEPEARTLPAEFWDYLFTFALLATILLVAIVVYVRVARRPELRRGRFSITQFVALLTIAGLIALAGTRPELSDLDLPLPGEGASSSQPSENEAGETSSAEDSRTLRIRWDVLATAGALLVLGVAVFAVRRRSNALRPVFAADDAATALSAALDESVDDLRAERDPRRAVIAAYARMEMTLERRGFPRSRAEAPLEYLARVLRELHVRSGAVLALTELFERAKFSRHEIDADMKEEAIGALIAVRDDLRPQA